MIEKGFEVLRRSGIADDYLEADTITVEQIYRVMAAVSGLEPLGFVHSIQERID
jgi:hypothetical protein